MNFLPWLQQQDKRQDEIGWLSRLIFSSQQAQDDLSIFASGYFPLVKYAQGNKGKINRSLIKAAKLWVKESAGSRIGIFWIVDGDVVEFADDANGIPVVSGFKDVPYDHVSQWTQMQRLFPQFKMKEYDQVPRGRVVGVGASGYRLFLPPELLGDQSLVSRVMRVFGLPQNATEVMGDEHYVTQEGDAYDDLNLLDDEYDPFDDEEDFYRAASSD